jgi:hypothetical protein
MKTIAYIMSTYHIGTHNYNSDIRDVLKSYIIARYYGWEPKEEDLEKPIEIQITSTREIPIEQNKRVQTKIKEIIYNNLYDTLVEELKDTISRFKAQYNIQEINPYISDILQNPEDLISRSNNKEYR